MISQIALSITSSPVHTVEYYMSLVDKVVAFGADEICLKDMAGIGRPAFLGRLTKAIKDKYPHIVVEYHGHSGPGFSVASMLEVARAGADYIDVAMEPIAWGMVHPDVITIQAMLKDAGFLVKDINIHTNATRRLFFKLRFAFAFSYDERDVCVVYSCAEHPRFFDVKNHR